MITKWLIQLVRWILTPVFGLLPAGTLPWLNAGDYTGTTTFVGQKLGGWDGLFPIVSMFEVLARTVAILLPAIMLYKLVNWIWKHIPTIGGFGPGAG